jgi:hypothetical protein
MINLNIPPAPFKGGFNKTYNGFHTMKLLQLLGFVLIFLVSFAGCGNSDIGKAKATIGDKTVKFRNAQAGISPVMGMYNVLSIVFGTRDGQGIGLTLVTRNKFEAKEYLVRYVDRPDIDNAQMTFSATNHKIYEAVSDKGSGSVRINELTDTYIKGTFSGIFVLQGDTGTKIEIKQGEFKASYTPTPPEF